MIFFLLSIFILSILLSYLLTPIAMQLAMLIGATDKPDNRKIHKQTMPRMGGVAIFLSFSFCLIFLSIKYKPLHYIISDNKVIAGVVVFAYVIIFLLGIWDDIQALKPGLKFFIQWFAATLLYLAGFHINNYLIPFELGPFQFVINYPLTVLWIIGITNAFNLIDGLDGLAAGIAAIAAITIGVISFLNGDYLYTIITISFMGAILGFLRYNFHPAKIFLGDSGSLFLGSVLAVLSLSHLSRSSTLYSLFIPIIALGLPVMDTLVSMFRRFIKSYLPDSSINKKVPSLRETLHNIFLPDKSHIHHQLLTCGFSHKGTVITLYLVSLTYGTGAIIISYFQSRQISLIVTFFLLTLSLIGINKLKYQEISLFRNGFFLPLIEGIVNRHRIIHHLMDIIFVCGSFVAAQLLVNGLSQSVNEYKMGYLNFEMLSICIIQIFVLSINGLYKESIKQLGIGDLLQIIKKVTLAVGVSFIFVLIFTNYASQYRILSFWLLDFYFMITTILGLRIAHPVLNYLFKRYRTGQKRRVLIYGADKEGLLALNIMLNSISTQAIPIGFMDEDPELEGQIIDGYPVFGGHWKLSRLLKTYNINQILITNKSIKPIVMDRIEIIANRNGANIQLFNVSTDDLFPSSNAYQQSFSITNHSLFR